jgi:hypothetical protein
MKSKLLGLVATPYVRLTHAFFVVLGCVGIFWGIVGFSVFWQQSSTLRIAGLIIAGHSFKSDILTRQLPIIESLQKSAYCHPAVLQSAAIIHLRMVEGTTSKNDRESINRNLKSLGNVIRSSLSCAPADPFLWLVLYWVENVQDGFTPEHLKYLKLSYQLGPNEGWVALKRSPVAFADYERLPPNLATNVINEYLALVKNEFYQRAVEILSGPAWRVRDALLPHLATLSLWNRETFARIVYNRGLSIAIPGVEQPDSKPPWR